MCSLYSVTTNQEAIRALFRVMNRYVGNLPPMDIYDGAEWTEMDVDDLRPAIEHDRSIEEAVEFLCRSGTVDAVAQKARELALEPRECSNS